MQFNKIFLKIFFTGILAAGLMAGLLTCHSSTVPESFFSDVMESETNDNEGETTAPAVAYSSASYSFVINAAIDDLAPTLTGTPLTNCVSAPSLPAGLSINSTSCAISGTPTGTQISTPYTITASNAYGNGSADISIEVTAAGVAPTVSYSGSPFTFTQNSAITTITPTLGGNTPTSCTSLPTLPAGLSINSTSCAISGTPTATQTATSYTITASNAYGNGTADISIEVTAPDTTPPMVSSTTPADTATGVAANQGTITVVFNEPMQSLTPTLTTETWDGSAWVAIPNTGTTFDWTNSTTLIITLSWVQFPETTSIQWTLGAANLKDTAGNSFTANLQQTFTTNSRNSYFSITDTGQTLCYNGSGTTACGDTVWPRQDADYLDTPNARSFTGPTAHTTWTSDYTTTDNVTGLVWKTCSEGLSGATCATGTVSTATWYNAFDSCSAWNTANSGAGYAGRTNWRLPTRAELASLVNYGLSAGPMIDGASFPATVANFYWSSSTYVPATTLAWYVRFTNGFVDNNSKTNSYYVRCVASGP